MIRVDGRSFTVVGVAPRGFTGTTAVLAPELSLPVGVHDDLAPAGEDPPAGTGDRKTQLFVLAGVLAPGLSIAAAQNSLAAVAKQMEAAYPAVNADQTLLVAPLSRLSVSPQPRDNGRTTNRSPSWAWRCWQCPASPSSWLA